MQKRCWEALGKALKSAFQGNGSGPGFEPGSDPIDKRCVANPPEVFPDPVTKLPENTALDPAWEKSQVRHQRHMYVLVPIPHVPVGKKVEF